VRPQALADALALADTERRQAVLGFLRLRQEIDAGVPELDPVGYARQTLPPKMETSARPEAHADDPEPIGIAGGDEGADRTGVGQGASTPAGGSHRPSSQ